MPQLHAKRMGQFCSVTWGCWRWICGISDFCHALDTCCEHIVCGLQQSANKFAINLCDQLCNESVPSAQAA